MNGCARSLALKERLWVIRKWSIVDTSLRPMQAQIVLSALRSADTRCDQKHANF